jgi:hypothetical protein
MICYRIRSGKEPHVCATDAVVGVADGTEQPLGHCALPPISTEEVVEDCRVEGADGTFTEIVIVGFDLGAAIVMGILDEDLDHVCVLHAELSQGLLTLVQLPVLHRGDETVKLLFLVPLAMLLNNDRASKVLE